MQQVRFNPLAFVGLVTANMATLIVIISIVANVSSILTAIKLWRE